jgi:formylglycine-generating enzyme required for sulfatase activity
MVWVEGGTFSMGSFSGQFTDERPPHMVTVRGFYMGKYEVTQKEWREVMGNNPSNFKGDNLPVEKVSWFNAIAYCNRRSEREGLTPAYTIKETQVSWNQNANGYRLPTEAEWEYAAKERNSNFFEYKYAGSDTIDVVGWYNGDRTHPVGTKLANSLGIYDLSGNVWEWCWDRYGNYPVEAQTNPTGPASGRSRVWRGGSWSGGADYYCRTSFRFSGIPNDRSANVGFRVVRS